MNHVLSEYKRHDPGANGGTAGQSVPAGSVGRQAAATICLLDDDPSVLTATERLLRAAGWEVETFTDPHAFLQRAERKQPALAVIDILMPIMNGLDVQTRLRTIAPATRVIVLTSKDDPLVRSKAMKAGARAFFLKPADEAKFLAGIESSLSEN